MAVKVGNSWVSEAALAYAQKSAAEREENGKSGILSELKEKFPNLKFTIGTKPFSGSGIGNVAIAPNILHEMENDPEKRLEYEALLYDVEQGVLTRGDRTPDGRKLKAQGVIIGRDGGLGGWSISESSNGGSKSTMKSVKRTEKKAWWQSLLDEMNKKADARKSKKKDDKSAEKKDWRQSILDEMKEKKEEQVKGIKEKSKEIKEPQDLPETVKAQQKEAEAIIRANAERVTILRSQSAAAKAYLASKAEEADKEDETTSEASGAAGAKDEKLTFSSTDDLMKYLRDNFAIVREGMASISSKYLRACLDDEEKRNKLFENLQAADDMLERRRGEVGFQGMSIEIDEDGEMSMSSSKATVSVNVEKRSRQIAAAATQGDLQTVMRLLNTDLEQCEAGVKNNMCDEAEVQKVKDLIARAEQRKAELGDTSDKENDPAAKVAFSINMLI